MRGQRQVNCAGFFSLFTRTKVDTKPASSHVETTRISDLLCSLFSGHYSLHLFLLMAIVIRNISGPAIVLSLIITLVIGLLTAACYAEFSSRFKHEGSSYFYTYTSLGELLSFLTGWTVLFSCVLLVAAMGRGMSEFIDNLVDGAINKFNTRNFGTIELGLLGSTLDFLAPLLIMLISSAFAGLVRSHRTFVRVVTSILTIINLLVVIFLVISVFFYGDTTNWTEPGMFLPYGRYGVLVGAAVSYSIYFTSESVVARYETSDSAYTVTSALLLSTPLNVLALMGPSAAVSFMVPYSELSPQAPLVSMFSTLGFKWGRYMLAVLGISSLFLGVMEIVYRMGYLVSTMVTDGLLPSFFAATDCREISVINYTAPAFLAALFALMFEESQLLDTLPVGPLLVSVSMATAVILVRYTPGVPSVYEEGNMCPCECPFRSPKYKKLQSNENGAEKISAYTRRIALSATAVIILSLTTILSLVVNHTSLFSVNRPLVGVLLGLSSVVFLTAFAVLATQPKNGAEFPSMVVFVPLTPVLLIGGCILLMLVLPTWAWMRFLFWFFLGLAFYFLYGVHNSKA